MGNRSLQQIVETSEYFDGDWYSQRYPDVKKLGLTPSEHFIRIGVWLLRDPGPDFSVHHYLISYPDVAKSGINPLLHYIQHGKAEGRKAIVSTPLSMPLPCEKRGPDTLKGFVLPGFERLKNEEVDQIRSAFDAEYYLANNQDVAKLGVDALSHYMIKGWREGRDPTADFCTDYYLDQGPDIRKAGINPFVHYILHGKRERRPTLPYRRRLDLLQYQPKVSVIVPNYNHGRFLKQRIESILEQTYCNVELLILDDCSTDNSREIIDDYCARYPARVRSIFNLVNSGNVFRQWRKGIENSDGELIWICESDDFCEPDFLESLVPHFKDRSVSIAFGRIQFSHQDGTLRHGLDDYRESAEPGIWRKPLVRPAQRWFAGAFGVNNVIANVGGCVWRRQQLQSSVWEEAQTYTILGDWFLYCQLAGGGQIAYEPTAVSYFRQHGGNTSVSSFQKAVYYEEHQRLMSCLCRRWNIPGTTIDEFTQKVAYQYQHFKLEERFGPFKQYVDGCALKRMTREKPHILIAFLGFQPGGGEAFPIALANALHAQGWLVSMLAYDMDEVNQQMLASLDSGIPVYCTMHVEEIGVTTFMHAAGISLVHSHMVALDVLLIERQGLQRDIPYLVSLHGSYEACGTAGDQLKSLANRVDHWAYTADKNLLPFKSLDIPSTCFSKIANGMPDDPRPFPQSRQDLGITEDAMVFAFVARGVEGKGWDVAPAAFQLLCDAHPYREMHLLMCGTGPEVDQAIQKYDKDPNITFLGYQSCIHGLYRLSDCAIVPTRYVGESFPLCIIQALQTGTPVIATKVGEIESMLTPPGTAPGGLLVSADIDTHCFTRRVCEAMTLILAKELRERLGIGAKALGSRYEIASVADRYGSLYRKMLTSLARHVDDARHESQSHVLDISCRQSSNRQSKTS